MNKKPKLIVILGQTATGKSDFAVQIAKAVNGEIISADSRQVYKGMDLGSGKVTKKEMQGIPHHLLSVVSPKKTFTVSDFKKKAEEKIEKILEKNKIPIICGGTGFYIDAVASGVILPEVPPDKTLRKKLYSKSAIALFEYLKELDPQRAKTIDKNNPARLIRAIEIATHLGKVPKIKNRQKYEVLKIGLRLPEDILKEKISIRLLKRLGQGMLTEIKTLHKGGLSWKRMEAFGLEYRYGAMYLQNKITKSEMMEKLNTEIWHYAKRQKTWFKKDKNTIWIDPRESKTKTLKKIKGFLK